MGWRDNDKTVEHPFTFDPFSVLFSFFFFIFFISFLSHTCVNGAKNRQSFVRVPFTVRLYFAIYYYIIIYIYARRVSEVRVYIQYGLYRTFYAHIPSRFYAMKYVYYNIILCKLVEVCTTYKYALQAGTLDLDEHHAQWWDVFITKSSPELEIDKNNILL